MGHVHGKKWPFESLRKIKKWKICIGSLNAAHIGYSS